LQGGTIYPINNNPGGYRDGAANTAQFGTYANGTYNSAAASAATATTDNGGGAMIQYGKVTYIADAYNGAIRGIKYLAASIAPAVVTIASQAALAEAWIEGISPQPSSPLTHAYAQYRVTRFMDAIPRLPTYQSIGQPGVCA
jgi:hypothetical protein